MTVERNQGIRVCPETAATIRELVAEAVLHFRKVPRRFVQVLRNIARVDEATDAILTALRNK